MKQLAHRARRSHWLSGGLLLLAVLGCSNAAQGPSDAVAGAAAASGGALGSGGRSSVAGSGGAPMAASGGTSAASGGNSGAATSGGLGGNAGGGAAGSAGGASGTSGSGGGTGKVSHRVLSSVSDRGLLAIMSAQGQIEWQYDVLSLGGEANDAWLLPNGDVVFAYKQGAEELTPAKQVVWNYSAPAGSEVHSCQPLSDGNFLIGEAHDQGLGYLREVDGSGKVQSTVTIQVPGGLSAHAQFREVRKTPQGTYLVTYLQLDRAMEFDGSGQKLREFPCGMFVAVRLPDGNTLISCGDDHRVIEVDPQDNVVWQVTESEIPGNTLGFAAGLERLPNGNTVICNWPGHTGLASPPPQAFELTRDKQVVWELDDARLGWVSNAEILDNLDSAPLR